MSEPFYIAQTFDQDIAGSQRATGDWFYQRAQEAAAKGGTFPRATISDDGKGLLFECWKERPDDQGEPRWQLAAGDDA